MNIQDHHLSCRRISLVTLRSKNEHEPENQIIGAALRARWEEPEEELCQSQLRSSPTRGFEARTCLVSL